MRYVDITRLVVVVVHGVPVVISGRREVRSWQWNVDIEDCVTKQVWNDSKVEFAFELEAKTPSNATMAKIARFSTRPSMLEYATEFSAVIGVIVPLDWSD